MAGDLGGVPVETAAGAVAAHDRARADVCGASWTSRSGTPAPGAAVMDVCPLPRPVLPVRKAGVEVTRVPVTDDSGAARYRAAIHPRTAGPLALGRGVAAGPVLRQGRGLTCCVVARSPS